MTIIKGGPGSGHFGHRGRPGTRGGSAPSGLVTVSYMLDPEAGGRLLSDPQAMKDPYAFPVRMRIEPVEEMPSLDRQKEVIIGTLSDFGVPTSHLEDLYRIANSVYEESEIHGEGNYTNPWGWAGVAGFYDPSRREIQINPRLLQDVPSKVLVHELGHHVNMAVRPTVRGSSEKVKEASLPVLVPLVYNVVGPKEDPNRFEELGESFGLRSHSLAGSAPELLADTYMTWFLGRDAQKENLYNLFREHSNIDLEKQFGP